LKVKKRRKKNIENIISEFWKKSFGEFFAFESREGGIMLVFLYFGTGSKANSMTVRRCVSGKGTCIMIRMTWIKCSEAERKEHARGGIGFREEDIDSPCTDLGKEERPCC
jgi:hypothetical protein